MRSFTDAAHDLQSGRTNSRDLVESCLAHIAGAGAQGEATFRTVYEHQARASAAAMDALRHAGRAPGPFAGIPISIKDLFDVAGETTCAASAVLRHAPAARAHATVIQRLISAGLVLIGRTNMTEFAFSGVGINPHYGTPRAPWDRATGRIPGGSSSGAAISVTDGFAFAGIGTDTGGSCRIPAALCGITGFKPTARRIPLQGALPLSPTLDSIGPLAHTAECCAALDAIMAGTPDRRLPTATIAGLRLLLPTNLAFEHLDVSIENALDRAVARLHAAGANIDRQPLLAIDQMNTAQAHGGFAAVEAYTWHRKHLESEAASYDPRVASRILGGAAMQTADYIALIADRQRIIGIFNAEMAGFDALILPTVPIEPPPTAAFDDDETYRRLNYLLLRNPSLINFVDGCAVSLPCHAPGAPPAGLMLAAPAMQDDRLLSVATAVQQAFS